MDAYMYSTCRTRLWYVCMSLLRVRSFASFMSAPFGHVYDARNLYGTISVVGPAFVNREVILKATPYHPWRCDVAWRYLMDGYTKFQTMNGTDAKKYSENGSFFLKLNASIEYNRADFYADCLTNTTISTPMITLNMKDINGLCGALVILSPVVRGAEVKLGYFPSDQSLKRQTFTQRTWKKDTQKLQLREGSHEEELFSEYLYILKILNFREEDKGTYTLNCNSGGNTDSVQLHISERPSYPVLGPKYPDFNTTECIYVYAGSDFYCKTEKGTEPVQVELLIERDSFYLEKSKGNTSLYRFQNIHQQMDGQSRRNVTCQVLNAAIETPYEVHGILCNVEKGSRPVLTVPEEFHGERSTLVCEVRNAFPAPAIEIRVDKVLQVDVQQIDLFNGSIHTFTSTVTMEKMNKAWNGKRICCTVKPKYEFGLENVSACKNIDMKYPPSDLLMSVNNKPDYNGNGFDCLLNLFCETNESNPPCAIEWSSDNDNLRYIYSSNWTNEEHGSYRSVSNVLYKVTEDMTEGTITCSTRCDHFPSHLYKDYTLSFSDFPLDLFMESAIEKDSNSKILNLTCHTGGTCIPCAITWSSNSVFLHPLSTSQWTKNSGSGYTSVSNALYYITKDVDGKEIQCSAKCWNDSSDSKHERYTISFQAFQAEHWRTLVLYALSGTLLLTLATTLIVLLVRRCKPHAYERFLRRRRPAESDPSRHVYDAVQSTVETTTLHDLRRLSATAPENTSPLSVMEEQQVRPNRNECPYDYVDTSPDHQNHGKNTPAASYIHAI
ncbi:uncharacterized protein LOC128245066 isoform X2 [Mya arenaria]|uniref:uncharacterized protein LOC128240446 n=1 Tax=Mya arenaria TaxID=6604 RepID=UPI0022E806F0|nr:uncharacterized protein LOC128240446 [Mya arenaria]XP_052819231.1 uncharacterized protein LOC128245066 isoform X2 [Mya arenaria]